MFCVKCGKEFEGNFCPNCGTAQLGTSTVLAEHKNSEPVLASVTTEDTGMPSSVFTLVGERWTIRSFLKIVTRLSIQNDDYVTGETNYGHIIGKKISQFSFHVKDIASIYFCLFFRIYFADWIRFLCAIALTPVLGLYGLFCLAIFLTLCFFQAIKITLKDGRIIKIPVFTKVDAREFIDYIKKYKIKIRRMHKCIA